MSDPTYPKSRIKAHGNRSFIYILGEGFCKVGFFLMSLGKKPVNLPPAGRGYAHPKNNCPEDPPPENRAFRFGRMFDGLEKFEPSADALTELGRAMTELDVDPVGNTTIPAGMTYLGQFIDHDITLDLTEGFPDESVDPNSISNGRTPGLDLDSLYGLGPDHPKNIVPYESDKVHLEVGQTTGRGIFGVTDSFPNDLPRRPISDPEAPRQALIGDGRNDENLAVAQTHLAFIKFHNKVADTVSIGPNQLRESQKIVRQHYQSIVLHDFLPRLVRQDVLDDVLANGRRFLSPGGLGDEGRPFMPVEFSVAAYRLGHSMVRNSYEWNRVFNSGGPGPIANMALVFEFSEVSEHQGIFTEPTVPSDWIIRWNSFHDFSDIPGVDNHAQFNAVRKIDTRLALKLDNLPEFEKKESEDEVEANLRSLAVRNLLRGMLVGLPSGQDVADAIGATKLTPDQVKTGDHEAILTAHGLNEETPLWYYILKEAEVFENGDRLGEVGSRILCETFHALLEGSADSILKEAGWTPSIPSVNSDHFTMADLLLFVGDINPIG